MTTNNPMANAAVPAGNEEPAVAPVFVHSAMVTDEERREVIDLLEAENEKHHAGSGFHVVS